MDLLIPMLCMCLMAAYTNGQQETEGPCFEFPGESYLQFTPNNFDNDNSIHYSLWFRTTRENGIILYGRGQEGDEEALYMRNGKLRYHLFNTSPTGVEGYFGAFLEGDEMVNTGLWIKVHIFRLWRHVEPPQRRVKRKTGFEVEIDGVVHRHVDYLERENISIRPTIFLGGYKESLSSTVRNFTGQINNIYEEKNGYLFENPSVNYMSKVSLTCIDFTPN